MNISETAAYLRTLDRVLILTHVRPDGDTVGSAAALCQALRDLGREAYLLYNPEITATYVPYAAPYWAPDGFTPAHVVAVDVATAGLLPENAENYAGCVELCVDHHPSNSGYAARTCLDASAAAAGEIVYAIIRELTDVTPVIALPLYVAIAADCGCFQYANTTANTHRVAAELMELVDVSAVNKALFRTKSKVRLAMESRMVADMELYDDDRVVVMQIPLALRQEFHATEADIEELSSLAALVEGTDCGITLRELKPGTVKISVRSGPRVDACAACAMLGGGGHRAAAGATVEGTMEEARAAILRAVAHVTEA
ncbi:MAG: DHH family phosphoesterase [Oscillospiraceae bacterium]|nr:DHH family phosphoesterase [Oscillospiraceae bacterium]